MATQYLRIAYNVNGGHVQNTSGQSYYYYSSGYTSYTSYTASTKYYYIKSTSTSAAVTGCASATGTYATLYQRIASTNTYPNLVNVATMNIVRDGYHIVGTSAYRTTATGGNVINQDYSSSSTTNPATYARLGGSTSANKTVTLYVNWIGNSYTVHFNASGGSGTMSDQTGFVFGTGKTLSSNTFTKTGYTFAGWSKSSGSTTRVFYVSDVGPYDPVSIGTDGTYLYFKQSSTQYYRVTVDDSNSYTDIGSTAPSGVSTWIGKGTHFTFQENEYYWSHTYSDNTGIDRCYIYRVDDAQTVDYTNGASMSDAAGTTPVEAGTTVVDLYAVWTPNTYSITYTFPPDDVGTWPSGASHPTTATYDQTFTVAHPVDGWYDFMGWYIRDMDSTTHIIGSSTTTSTYISQTLATSFKNLRATSGTVKFYAAWWGRTYGFNSGINGATYAAVSSEYVSSEDSGGDEEEWLIFPSTAGTISGWTFIGWRKDSTATNPQYALGEEAEIAGTTELEFNAIYSRTITLTFSNGGGTGTAPASLTATQYYNSAGNVSVCSFTMPTNPFYRPGYRFNNWEYGAISVSEYGLFAVNSGVTEASTFPFVAQWTPVVYIKQSDTWKEVVPQIKANGTWKTPTSAYIKVSGTWKQIY